ncbi:extracellular solute-binding protein [Alphaproteobacteria bacterium]|nr:extracellular solute-binding protein [Alphaproteobacteria bacterium]
MKKYLLGALVTTIFSTTAIAGEVNVYSYRQAFLTSQLFAEFEKKTGHKVNVLVAKKGLLEKVKSEGKNTKADVIMTVDISNLYKIKQMELSQSVNSNVVNSNVPASMRDVDGKWIGLSQRARIIYTSKDRVEVGAINSYADLADPKWKGKICIRSGTHKYNIGLISYMINRHGEEKAHQWLKGLKDNLARNPTGNDRAQIKGVYEGVCDIAIGNHYYYGKMLDNQDQKVWADSVNLVWPDQSGQGTHINLAGIALTKYAKNKDIAIELIEFLSSDYAQKIYAEANNEIPVNPNVPVSNKVKSWLKNVGGKLKVDTSINLSDVAEKAKDAVKLVNKTGFNE